MKYVVLLIAVLSMSTACFAQIWEGDLLGLEGDLHGTVGVTYDSKYIWRGFDVYADKSAIHPFVDLDLFQTGFGINLTMHRANSSGFEDWERWDYTLYYQNGLFGGEPYATNYRFGYMYYNFPDHSADWFDLQELHAVLSWPNLIPVKGLCPSYVLVKLWPAHSGSTVEGRIPGQSNVSGFAHIFMLDYAFAAPGILPEVPEQLVKLHSELVYNDGVHPGGGNADQDWSNAVIGASTDFDLGYSVTFTPGIYYQVTMDNSVNRDDDETWVSLTLRYAF